MAKCVDQLFVKFTFESKNEAAAADAVLTSVRYTVKTDDALAAVAKASVAAQSLFGDQSFKCTSVNVSNYSND